MRFSKSSAKKMFAANPVIIGAAFLALVSFSARSASAQTVSLTPLLKNNPFDTSHTVTAQVSGVCAAIGGGSDSDGEGAACNSNADCALLDHDAPPADEFCDFSGVTGDPMGFIVTGTNNLDNNFATTVDVNGQATFTYQDTNGLGTDTIQACLDADAKDEPAEENVAGCILSSPAGDFASNKVTKNWVPTLTLSPPGAFNPIGATHTVTATLNGVPGKCTTGATTSCLTDATCAGRVRARAI